MKTITICGKELRLGCNMATLVAYEQMTDASALDPTQFSSGKLEPIVQLGFAMLISNNNEEDVPEIKDMMKGLSTQESIREFVETVTDEYLAFIKPMPGDKKEDDKPEGEPKNA